MSKSYEHCQYRDCSNVQSEEIKLFRFPAKHDPRCEIWITNSGNEAYLRKLKPSTIRKACMCNAHFLPGAFWDKTRRKLRPKQIPIPYTAVVEEGEKEQKRVVDSSAIGGEEEDFNKRTADNVETRVEEEDERETYIGNRDSDFESVSEVEEDLTFAEVFHNEEDELHVRKEKVLKTYSSANMDGFITVDEDDGEIEWLQTEPPFASTSSRNEEKCIPLSDERKIGSVREDLAIKLTKMIRRDEAEKRKMARKIESLQQQLKTERTEYKKKMAAIKRKKVSVEHFLDARRCESPVARAVVNLQLRKGKRPFTEDEKEFAKRLCYYSNSAYRFMKQVGMKLPALSTVRSWIAEYGMKPGFRDVICESSKENEEDTETSI
ncbi:uncharacterized protein LOC117173364 [Belonocnema kinseyi]|uniref:uncharacterized protein LOC117173364 n=1 Tax=Belonocnema kinseyi TaxID=2817044 RepID=UPI00143CC744|nr:uncharacterized protein LOC117173364 [Belonocnema kinseyi]